MKYFINQNGYFPYVITYDGGLCFTKLCNIFSLGDSRIKTITVEKLQYANYCKCRLV
jgi:hypothetical protein